MNRNIVLGQYYPGDSFIHNIDSRAKILSAIIYIVAVFLCKSVYAYAFITVLTLVMIITSTVPIRILLRGMKPLLIIIIITSLLNLFWSDGKTLLFTIGPVKITLEALLRSVFMILRISLLVIGSGILLTYTTTPIDMTGGLESLLNPLKKIKVPVHEFSMMMMIALRFIPTLMEETDKIINAQKARCADFDSGNLIKRAKSLIPVLIPLFVSSFRRADELAIAMESRCYHGGEGRTRMNVTKIRFTDILFILFFVLLIFAVIAINNLFPTTVYL